MIAVGLYARKSANSMTDFVLGGRSVGPWLSAFAYGTSYFSAVVFVHLCRQALKHFAKQAMIQEMLILNVSTK